MPYRYVTERQDYTDYSAGRVLYGQPGHPAFPVRLASEILQRCIAFRETLVATGPATLFDPCCGGAYHLTTLAYLHWDAINTIVASDIDTQTLAVAQRNLDLLTLEGLDRRIVEIEAMFEEFGKPSHALALESAQRLRERLLQYHKTHALETATFTADATHGQAVLDGLNDRKIDIVISDIPYGQHSTWQSDSATPSESWNPIALMLDALLPVLADNAVVAIITDKSQKVAHERYRRVERFNMGKRRVVMLRR